MVFFVACECNKGKKTDLTSTGLLAARLSPVWRRFTLLSKIAILFQGSVSLSDVIAPLSAQITGSLWLSVIGDRPSYPIYRVERTSSRAGVAPAEVQRRSRRTFSPIERELW